MERTCSIDDCVDAVFARGWCGRHYNRWRAHGNPLTIKRGGFASALEVFQRNTATDGECLIWVAGTSHGYGRFSFRRTQFLAHRFSLELKLGRPIREGFGALHICDNPKCCSQDHLYEGTQAENMHDMSVRGRAHGNNVRGDAHYKAVLTSDDVLAIREMISSGSPAYQIWKTRFGNVSYSTVKRVANRKNWHHL